MTDTVPEIIKRIIDMFETDPVWYFFTMEMLLEDLLEKIKEYGKK